MSEPHKEFLGFTVSETIGIGTIIATAAGLLWRTIARPLAVLAFNIAKTPTRVAELAELVKHELMPNNGGSMYDKVMKGESVLSHLTHEFSLMTHTVSGLKVSQQILLSEMSVPVWESNAEGHCLWINETFTAKTGWTLADIQGENWRENVVYQDDRDIVNRAWDEAIKGQRMFRLTYRWRTKDGRTLLVEGRTKEIVAPSGEVIGYFGMARILE